MMISRRDFLGASSAAAAGAALGTPDALLASSDVTTQAMPPSIARLTSWADRVRPITTAERAARVEKAKRLMRANGLDAIFLTGGTSMVYFTNIRWGGSERLFTVVIPVSGDAFVVCPAFEEDRAREQLALGPLGGAEVRTWEEHENPYQRVAEGLRARGIATGRVGAEETVQFRFSNGVAESAPGLQVVSGTPVTAGCRGVKDAHEIELMKLANEVTLTAYKAAYLAMEEGMSQRDVGGLISSAHSRLGFQGGASVQTGEFAALPHGSITPQVIREGTILLIDGGCTADGYQSDMSRTFVLGSPSDKMKRVFDIEFEAQTAAWKAAGPGVPGENVDAAARKVIVDAGYGPDYTYFSHRVGHGIGMDGHEWPYLVRGNREPLLVGNSFSDEPGIYIPREFGVRLEDIMVITESGADLLTPQSPSLEDPFGNWPH
ncbi:MAG: Xaa-Pro peptidase family protein [Gemmatimonadetes bacterium]|nr:Xaa-Pro peptidase family protein [Gemmatimonadota bacterium]MDA1103414.1 Xaa-Pro peptidase family protein [Gemmatimonadota bacterium]